MYALDTATIQKIFIGLRQRPQCPDAPQAFQKLLVASLSGILYTIIHYCGKPWGHFIVPHLRSRLLQALMRTAYVYFKPPYSREELINQSLEDWCIVGTACDAK